MSHLPRVIGSFLAGFVTRLVFEELSATYTGYEASTHDHWPYHYHAVNTLPWRDFNWSGARETVLAFVCDREAPIRSYTVTALVSEDWNPADEDLDPDSVRIQSLSPAWVGRELDTADAILDLTLAKYHSLTGMGEGS